MRERNARYPQGLDRGPRRPLYSFVDESPVTGIPARFVESLGSWREVSERRFRAREEIRKLSFGTSQTSFRS